jgi:glutamate 5-kinase
MLVVIKIGSNILTTSEGRLDQNNLKNLCNQVAALREKEISVVVVTSGAIVSGSERLKIKPVSIPEKQAAAAVGQSLLVNDYNAFLEPHGLTVAQVLLTKDGLEEPARRENTSNTLKTLLRLGAVPLINENDTVAVDEIKFGDNDMLSANVAVLLNVDKLIILTDIDGLHTANPRTHANTQLIPEVTKIDPSVEALASEKGSGKGVGGMVTKLNAAKLATTHGIETIVANGREPAVLTRIVLQKELVGTRFLKQ